MIKERINRWLNNGTEKRAGYTDLITQAILSRANSTVHHDWRILA